MKNCVTFILTFADLLLRDCSEFQLQFLEPLKEAAKLLMFTMSDWLDNTKLENNAFIPTFTDFKIVEAIQEITKMCRMMLGRKNVELKCFGLEGLAITLRTDRQRFQQVLLNLITNASKYAPKGSHIDCCFNFSSIKERLFVEVRDYGLGLTADECKGLFKPYSRVKTEESRKKNPTGIGLGLFICKRIVEALNGSIEVESEYGEYTVFSFSIRAEEIFDHAFTYKEYQTVKKGDSAAQKEKKKKITSKAIQEIERTDPIIKDNFIIEDQLLVVEDLNLSRLAYTHWFT